MSVCPLNASYKPHVLIRTCTYMGKLYQYIHPMLTHFNQQCDHRYWYTYISYFWNMHLNKYACKLMYVYPTALLLYSTCRSYLTAHINVRKKSLITMLWPYTCQQQICPLNATYMSHIPISPCAHMRQLCQHINLKWTHCNQQCDHKHWYTYMSHYWHIPWTNIPAISPCMSHITNNVFYM